MLTFSAAFDPVRAIKHGIEALKREPVGLLLGSFLMAILDGGGGGGGGNNVNMPSDSDGIPSADGMEEFLSDPAVLTVMVVALGCVCMLQIAFWLGKSFVQPGYIALHEQLLVEGTSSPGKVFSGGARFKSMAMWKLLRGVIGLGTAAVALAPGGIVLALGIPEQNEALMLAGGLAMLVIGAPAMIYVGLGLWLGDWAVALEDLGPMDALERSWDLARGNRLRMFLFAFVVGLFNFIGILLCCVGVFATKAVGDFGTTEAYLLATREGWEDWALLQEIGLD